MCFAECKGITTIILKLVIQILSLKISRIIHRNHDTFAANLSMTIHNELQQQHEQHRHYELHSNPQHLAWALISTCPIIDFRSTKELVRFCFGLELHSCQSFGYLVRPEDALNPRLALN